jgi:hypothetical protein
MKRFNYSQAVNTINEQEKREREASSIVSQPQKTPAQARLDEERGRAQSVVDGVLYQDPKEARRSLSGAGSDSSGSASKPRTGSTVSKDVSSGNAQTKQTAAKPVSAKSVSKPTQDKSLMRDDADLSAGLQHIRNSMDTHQFTDSRLTPEQIRAEISSESDVPDESVKSVAKTGSKQSVISSRFKDDPVVDSFMSGHGKSDSDAAIEVMPDAVLKSKQPASNKSGGSPKKTNTITMKAVPASSYRDDGYDNDEDRGSGVSAGDISPKHRPAKRNNANGESVIKKFPTIFADMAYAMFPDAGSMVEAIGAYIYYHEGMPEDVVVSDRIRELAMNCDRKLHDDDTNDALRDISSDMKSLVKELRSMKQKVNALEMALAYVICDRAGSVSSRTFNEEGECRFNDSNVISIMASLEKQSDSYQAYVSHNKGRPTR